MLTEEELAALESLLIRARAAAGQARSESGGTVNVGDLVQLRPGADSHWQTSLLLVCKVRDDGRICGVVLRPHRSGARDAWYAYSPPEVLRIGRAPFPPPDKAVTSASYLAKCPRHLGRDGTEPFDPNCPACLLSARADAAAKPKPIQQEKPTILPEDQEDSVEIAVIQLGERLWWTAFPEPKPIQQQETGKRKPDLAEVQQAIEELPKQDDSTPVPEPMPKPIQRETLAEDQQAIEELPKQDGGEIAALRIGQWWVVDMPQKNDYSRWLTQQQAAEACGVNVRTIGRWAEAKLIRSVKLKRSQSGPRIPVYHPGDVERIAQERDPEQDNSTLPDRKPIQRETRGRKRKPTNLAEIQDAIAALPKDQQAALAAWLAERDRATA